jgi:hypothetical protein
MFNTHGLFHSVFTCSHNVSSAATLSVLSIIFVTQLPVSESGGAGLVFSILLWSSGFFVMLAMLGVKQGGSLLVDDDHGRGIDSALSVGVATVSNVTRPVAIASRLTSFSIFSSGYRSGWAALPNMSECLPRQSVDLTFPRASIWLHRKRELLDRSHTNDVGPTRRRRAVSIRQASREISA